VIVNSDDRRNYMMVMTVVICNKRGSDNAKNRDEGEAYLIYEVDLLNS